MKINYIRPARKFRLPAHAVKTYQVKAPRATHWRPATCDEVDCLDYKNGWRVRVEHITDAQRYAIEHSGYKYMVLSVSEGVTYFMFGAGQACFRSHEHMLPIGRPYLYVVSDGDPWRGNPRGTKPRVHTRPEHWVEDFAEHQQRLHDRWKQG